MRFGATPFGAVNSTFGVEKTPTHDNLGLSITNWFPVERSLLLAQLCSGNSIRGLWRGRREAVERMSEQLISDRFVKLYYNHLAYTPDKLEVIYGADSVAKFHDIDSVAPASMRNA